MRPPAIRHLNHPDLSSTNPVAVLAEKRAAAGAWDFGIEIPKQTRARVVCSTLPADKLMSVVVVALSDPSKASLSGLAPLRSTISRAYRQRQVAGMAGRTGNTPLGYSVDG